MTKLILTNPQELETWLDAFMSEQMDKLHIPDFSFTNYIRLYSLPQLLEFIGFSLLTKLIFLFLNQQPQQ